MQDFSTSLQKSTRNSSDKLKFFKQRKLSAVETDCRLYNSDPPAIPKKFENMIADIPDVLQESASDHYKGKSFDEPLQIDPKKLNDRKAVEKKWTSKEIDLFESLRKTYKGKCSNKKKFYCPLILKNKLKNKSNKEIIEYFYMFHKINEKERYENDISKVPFTTEQSNVQNSSAENEQNHSEIDLEADDEDKRLAEEVLMEIRKEMGQ